MLDTIIDLLIRLRTRLRIAADRRALLAMTPEQLEDLGLKSHAEIEDFLAGRRSNEPARPTLSVIDGRCACAGCC